MCVCVCACVCVCVRAAHTPDNSFMGFVAEEVNETERRNIQRNTADKMALVYGKEASMWKVNTHTQTHTQTHAHAHTHVQLCSRSSLLHYHNIPSFHRCNDKTRRTISS